MNTLRKIAKQIVERVHVIHGDTPRLTKTLENEVFNLWVGAYVALLAIDHADAAHVGGYLQMVISVRGWRETLHLAQKADAEEVAA